MYLIQEVMVSDEILERHFCCDVSQCKGACCWEGDYGAPLLPSEIKILDDQLDAIKPYLTESSQAMLVSTSYHTWYADIDTAGTQLHGDGACIFMTKVNGIATCGIEAAYEDGKLDFQKPISCHLYPIRITRNKEVNFEAANYSQWDVCGPALKKGASSNVTLVEFLEKAIKRNYGEDFYQELFAAAERHDRVKR